MRHIVHRELGDPARVLAFEEAPVLVLAPGQVRIQTTCVPIHPGDLGCPIAG
jgi:NADPH:quinone reductase-like Zn-dependent oxidoreductase